jgi:hypothetical protein
MDTLLRSGVFLSCKLFSAKSSSSEVTGTDDISNLAFVIGLSSITVSAGFISLEKLAATEVKKVLNFCAILNGLFKIVPLQIISEIEFFTPFLLIASFKIDQVFLN